MSNSNLRKLYTEKQITALKSLKKPFWLLINHGAKRSGKTVADNDIFLLEVKRVRDVAKKLGIAKPQYILAGNSLGNIERNILIELSNKYGLSFTFDKYNRFELFGVLVCCFGHGTIRDISRIRGMTSFGAYINEATTATEEVIREILNRCSGEGARVIMDTNPDNPEHFIKKDYIDKADNEKIIEIHYQLDDNTFLSDRYKENVKATTPGGLFYDRDILGLWVNSEGVVYQDFNKSMVITDEVIKNTMFTRYIAGVDWGYEHLGTMVVVGITAKGNYILIEEIAEQHQEIDFWVAKARDIIKKYGNIPFYCDSARPEHVARFLREGFRTHNADKSILSGIEVVAKLMKQNKFFVSDKCNQFLKEVYNYVWDDKKGLPVKTNDDLMDAIRYAIYTYSLSNQTTDYYRGIKGVNYLDKRTW